MSRIPRRTLLKAAAITPLGAVAAAAPAFAQGRPAATLIVGFPAGGDTDAIGRLLADKLAAHLGGPLVVSNRPGAAGTLGASQVANSPPDGNTLLLAPKTLVTAPLVLKLGPGAQYDPITGFEPVIMVATQPLVLIANPDRGLASLPDVVRAAKGGKGMSYGSPGAGSPPHIVGEWLNREAGIRLTHAPYRGIAPAVTDVLAGHIDLAWVPYGVVQAYVQQKRLLVLATSEPERTPLAPDLPTLKELGYPAVVNMAWNGIFVPRGTPAPMVAKLNEQINAVLAQPDVALRLKALGAVPVGGPPSRLSQAVAADHALLRRVIQDLGITGD